MHWFTDLLTVGTWYLNESLTPCMSDIWLIHGHTARLICCFNCFTSQLTSKRKWQGETRHIKCRFHCVLNTAVLINNSCLFQQISGTPHTNSSLNILHSTTTIQLLSNSVLTAARVMESFYSDDKLFIQIRYTQANIVLFENHGHAELRIIFWCAVEQFRRAFILIRDDNSRKSGGRRVTGFTSV
jgi:hypothetical protein